MINLEINQDIININNSLSNLSLILYNSGVLLYKKILQKSLTYAPFDNATINYDYVPPNLQYNFYFTTNQIQVIMAHYVNNVNNVITMIVNSGLESQFNNKINQLNESIAQLNDFAISLYNGSNNNIIHYITPNPMSIRSALLLNGLSLNNMELVIIFNMDNINTLNYIDAGVELILL